MAKEGQWMFNYCSDGVWGSGSPYDNKEDAIKEGISMCDTDETHFYVGQVSSCFPSLHINAEYILETISDNTYDEVGEVAEDYLYDVKDEYRDILEERLNKVLSDWMDEFGYKPNFFRVINVEKIELGG